ncbi:hypothetical protein KAR91_70685 [Candidatus Pacearchaeota archaeon]|nr:hypothetical protein [Candidatus Pacearchaeota archaeon]
MERPNVNDEKYKLSNDFECIKFHPDLYLADINKHIDQIEAENKKLKEASSILNSLSKEKPCPVCKNKMDYKPRLYHCNYCGSDFN